jgi:signal transduction histidine kinase
MEVLRIVNKVVAAALTAAALSQAWAQPPVPKRVLLLFQDDGAAPAYVELEQRLSAMLRESMGPTLEFYREQLDAGRFPDKQEQRIANLRALYGDRHIAVVVFVATSPVEVLPGVPVGYVGNFPSELVNSELNGGNSVGVWMRSDPRKTIAVARMLQPRSTHVLVISGSSERDLTWLNEFHFRLRELEPKLSFEYVSDDSVAQLQARVSRLPRDTIVLVISCSRDHAGNHYVPRDVAAMLARASSAPVYIVSDTFVGTGAVGGYVVSWARAGEVAAQATREILLGKAPNQVAIPSAEADLYMFDWRQLKRWGFSERLLPPGSVIAFRVPTAWEQYRWRIIGTIALILTQSLLILGLLISRSHRRRAEASLHDMTGRLLESQDDERRRIARDLHDGTGQHLSGMALTIGQVLADFPPGHEQLRRLLEDSHVASRQALDEVRTVSYVLHPPILDGLGLVSALQWYLEGLRKRTDINIVFDGPAKLERLSPEAERALFRIVQEGVTNTLRHSGGSGLTVKLSSTSKAVTLEIEDNGHGLNLEELAQLQGAAMLGVGIAGMRERIRQLHGVFTLQSNAEGTRVTATVPLDRNHHVANHAGG